MPTDDFSSRRSIALRALLASFVLGLALWIRILDLSWGLPWIEEEALPMKKAFEMWGWGDGTLRLDPQTAGWPSLSFYVHLLLQHLQFAWGKITGAFHTPLDFFVAYQVDPSNTVIWARSVSVLASMVVVVVAMRIAWKLTHRNVPWVIAGLVLALSPLFVAQSQMVSPDILLTLFAALCIDRILEVGASGRTRDYVLAGVFAGLGTAAKYTPLLLCLSLYLVHLQRRRREGRSLRSGGFDDARLGWAAVATVLAFCLASPYTFADLEILRRDFSYQMLHLRRGHFGHTAQGPGYLYYLRSVLGPGLGWPMLVTGIGGLGWAAWRLRERWLDLLLCALPLALVLGSLSTRFDRYMLPLLLPLALGSAGFFWLAAKELRRRMPRRGEALVWGLAFLACVPTARGAWRHHETIEEPSTQTRSATWLEARGPDITFATEHYGPHIRNDERAEVEASPVFQRLDPQQHQALLGRPFLAHLLIPLYSARVELGAFYYDLRFLQANDYVVTSGAVRKRYEAAPDRFPRQNQFYRDLDRYADLAVSFEPADGMRGPEQRIYHITDTTRHALTEAYGELEPGFCEPWYPKVHRPHFLGFLEGVAVNAVRAQRFRQAALFYGALLKVSPVGDRSFVLERYAFSQLRVGNLPEAAAAYSNLVDDPKYAAVACANLGLVRERQGRTDDARRLYRKSLEAGSDANVRAWVQNRLRLLGP